MPRDVGTGIYRYPDGTPGISGQTIFSARYNTFLDDLSNTLNTALPINMGGTGSTTAAGALVNLGGEVAMQVVTNYDSHDWKTGSFKSASGATNSPDGAGAATNPYVGTVQVTDANNIVVEATIVTTGVSVTYIRKKIAGSWGGWTLTAGAGGFVLKSGDTMTGTLKVTNGELQTYGLGGDANSGVVRFNSGGNRYLYWNGSVFTLSGPLVINGAVNVDAGVAAGGAVTANAGVVSYAGRVVSTDGSNGQPCFSCWSSNRGAAMGMFLDTSNKLAFGATDGSGAPASNFARFDHSGNFTVDATLTAGSFWSSGNVSGGNLIGNTATTNEWMRVGNNYAKGGTLYFGADNTTYLIHDGSNFSLTGNLFLTDVHSQTLWANNVVYSNNGFRSTSGSTFQLMLVVDPGWGQNCYLYANHIPGNKVIWNFQVGGSSNFEFDHVGGAKKAGGGPWSDISDARIKTVLGKYDHGLNEVLKLDPVRYVYKGNDTVRDPAMIPDSPEGLEREEQLAQYAGVTPTAPYKNSQHYGPAVNQTEYIGLIAQAVDPVMPELVSKGPGMIDGKQVTDMHTLDTNALIFALVNAVKTLAARVEALEGA